MAPKHGRPSARPRRAGENYARSHHLQDGKAPLRKVKFDVRNPSALAFEEKEEQDAFLEADSIGRSAATKRGAVNIDGFESDSENETFNARAQERKKNRKGDVDLNEAFDHYGERDNDKGSRPKDDEDDDLNMFADEDSDTEKAKADEDDPDFYQSGKKKKEVRFLDDEAIVGQDQRSKSGGNVKVDRGSESESSEDEVDDDQHDEIEVDEEVGAGGLKKHAPKLEAFNLKEELEEGRFDENQNYVRNAGDAEAVHDLWLEDLDNKHMKRVAMAHQKRDRDAEQLRRQEDSLLTSELLSVLLSHLERGETPLEALARLGKARKKEKREPAWKQKRKNRANATMDVDADAAQKPEDADQARIKTAIETITDAADKLLSRDHAEIYDHERELLLREYKKDTGEDWVDPRSEQEDKEAEPSEEASASQTWQFRWTDGRDGGAIQGPFDEPMMKAWQDAGYFGEGVEFRLVGGDDGWSRLGNFG